MSLKEYPPLTVENQEVVPIVRVVTVAPISVKRFYDQIRAGISIDDIEFTKTRLIQKSNISLPSSGLVMPIGGELCSDENVYSGGLREVAEETTLLLLTQPSNVQELDNQESITFHIPGYNIPRKLQMFVLPVQSSSFAVHEPREGNNGRRDKIEKIISFSHKEVLDLINSGVIIQNNQTIRAADHFTTSNSAIQISENDKIKQKMILQKVTTDIANFEASLRQATLKEINLARGINNKKLASELNMCDQQELIIGFIAAQMRMALSNERNRELVHSTYPPIKADLLKIINYFSAENLQPHEMLKLLLHTPTRETLHTINTFKRAFTKAIEAVFAELKNKNIIEKTEPTYKELKSTWPKILNLPPTQRVALIKKADEALTKSLSEELGISQEDIVNTLQATESFHNFITKSLQRQKDTSNKIFQEFRPMNEISNATIFTRIVLALNMHPNVPIQQKNYEELRILRFEALRDLSVFAVGLEVFQQLKKADNSMFQALLDTMFTFPPNKEMINFGNDEMHPVYHRTIRFKVGGKNLHIITDERLKKEIHSGIRKKFQDPDLFDIYSINFVIAENNFRNSDSIQLRIQTAELFKDKLIQHIQKQLDNDPAGWQVSILPGTHKRTSLDNIIKTSRMTSTETKSYFEKNSNQGKRAGSKGDAIIREKFILKIENNKGEEQLIEVCIYPIQSTKNLKDSKLSEAGYWGFSEKLHDDFTGNYEATRILARDMRTNPLSQSLYESLFPGQFYEILSMRLMSKHVDVKT